ncbi:MAG: GNAT family N-acetyltransferase [Eubacterium sp.]|nr:GNAT family N-acetyltransferase [Eubacterium sp.]
MGKVIFRKGEERDLDRIAEIYNEFLDYEAEHGTKTNWIKGVYPTRKNAERGLENGTLYVGELDGQVVGSYVLNHIQPEEYAKLQWEYPGEGEEVIVIHTLCIDVNLQGKGLGPQFVEYALEHGRKLGCKTMRLDTYEHNDPAAKMYDKMGFRYVGITEFFFEQAILENLICFEYKLC